MTNDVVLRMIEKEAQITKNEARDNPHYWNIYCQTVHDNLKSKGLETSALAALDHKINH